MNLPQDSEIFNKNIKIFRNTLTFPLGCFTIFIFGVNLSTENHTAAPGNIPPEYKYEYIVNFKDNLGGYLI